jgi:PPK2 family polyphosphate:nucleotide phosphotransferase
MDEPRSVRAALAFANSSGKLADIDPSGRPELPRKRTGKPKKLSKLTDELAATAERIADLQQRLWAEAAEGGTRSLLIVLQGIDTAGKGGTTEHVIGACGPIGVRYTAFKKPTPDELEHNFLWRIRRELPPPGVIGIFDRSHYEDVLVVRVHELVPEDVWSARYEQINAFEQELVDGGTTVLKCFLHISRQTQLERLLRRLDRPDKHWKFNEADIDERARWDDYQAAFQAMLENCDTTAAPWYVVPADSKKYRNWAVGELVRATLESMNPQYPQGNLDVPALRARLTASGADR